MPLGFGYCEWGHGARVIISLISEASRLQVGAAGRRTFYDGRKRHHWCTGQTWNGACRMAARGARNRVLLCGITGSYQSVVLAFKLGRRSIVQRSSRVPDNEDRCLPSAAVRQRATALNTLICG